MEDWGKSEITISKSQTISNIQYQTAGSLVWNIEYCLRFGVWDLAFVLQFAQTSTCRTRRESGSRSEHPKTLLGPGSGDKRGRGHPKGRGPLRRTVKNITLLVHTFADNHVQNYIRYEFALSGERGETGYL